ncbi:MAG TPA: asparagine synthase (glutamine-hydrolyzing) [Flavitalea sp.]|nr:asparagine synthase (glutamine-hydrolyzing) [Flavitalea sp.]
MCGITGVIFLTSMGGAPAMVKKMTAAIAHRGPDGERFFSSPTGKAHFGHRRLCVIDPSPQASQPMHYGDRYTILHNGEIYNYKEIRERLLKEGCDFLTHSDTEVIVAAYHRYGEKAVALLDGMFAFVIWDEVEQKLFMARDRFGEKPLYFHVDIENSKLYFGSEMKALWAAGVPRRVHQPALLQYLSLGYRNEIESSDTYYEQISQIPPGHFATFHPGQILRLVSYWDIDKLSHNEVSAESAIEKFRTLLHQSIERRLRSDVPVGATLSGGIDSASIIGIAASSFHQPLPCFSAIFPGHSQDESEYMKLLVTRYGLKHYPTIPDPEKFIKDFDKLIYHQEEPFSSSSVYAQFKVYELAAAHNITVLLDGQGADEILGGYIKYLHYFLSELSRTQRQIFRKEKQLLVENGKFSWKWQNKLAAKFPNTATRYLALKEKKALTSNAFIRPEYANAYAGKVSIYKPIVETLNDALYYNTRQNGLPELLRYADRNAMAHGREARFPFLSHELATFVFSLPATYKIREGFTKWILRKSSADVVPDEITWRKDKIGFEPPQLQWMEDLTVQDYIRNAKETLVRARVLKASVLEKKIQPHSAYAAENYDWRFLIAGSYLT